MSPAHSPECASWLKSVRFVVLVVDDGVDILESVGAALRDHGFRVNMASDPNHAITRAIVDRPDVIVMDLAMPRLDGLAATRLLKKEPRTKAIPVVRYPAPDGRELGTMARAVGCAPVVGQESSSTALLAAIESALHNQPLA